MMRVFHTDGFSLSLPPGHRYPMPKYGLLRQRLLAEGVVALEELVIPHAATDEDLGRVHEPTYLHRVVTGALSRQEVRRIGFPWSTGLVERSRRSVGGTIGAAVAALEDGLGVTLAGGTHHAFPDRGEGYCVFNDVAVAARAVQAEHGIGRVLVVDCDVHQGNGTVAAFRNDSTVFTLGVYGAGNYPFAKERGDLDVPLPDGTRDDEYLAALEAAVPDALRRARPDIAFYLAGADPYVGDRLGRLALTVEGLGARDRTVFELLRAAGVPVAVTMAGGYAADIRDTVGIHVQTVRIAREVCGA
jgi:acetoin utilization deacetylase AcuC-like enzyme